MLDPTRTEPTPLTPAATTAEPTPAATDAELEQLKLEQAKHELRAKILATRLGTASSLAPAVADAPKGEVALGEKSGSLGPWLAHRTVATAGEEIAGAVRALDLPAGSVVLVTDDPTLLVGDVLSQQVQAALTARATELGAVRTQVLAAVTALEKGVAEYQDLERAPGDGVELERAEALVTLLAERTGLLDASLPASTESESDAEQAETTEEEKKEEESVDAAEADAGGTGGAGSPFAAAVDLVRLLATDFTLTGSEVQVRSATLATLTAGALAPGPDPVVDGDPPAPEEPALAVVLDGFTMAVADNATLTEYRNLAAGAYQASLAVAELRAKTAAVAAEAAEYKVAADKAQTAWQTVVASKEPPPGAAETFKTAYEAALLRVTRRTGVASAATSAADAASVAVAAARADLVSLTTADAKGVLPLIRTCSREGLRREDASKITHVLLVEATHAGADLVTRRSILGSSGRVGYLAGTNTTWALVAAGSGHLVGGGPQASALQMTHDLTTGKSTESTIAAVDSFGADAEDPLVTNEKWLRAAVLVLALGFVLLGVAAMVSVIGSFFTSNG